MEIPVDVDRKQFAEALFHVSGLALCLYFLTWLLSIYIYIAANTPARSSFIIAFLGILTAFHGLHVLILYVLVRDVSKVTLSDDGVNVEYRRLLPRALPWSNFDGYSTSRSLLYLHLKRKRRGNTKRNLVIPLSQIDQETLELIKTAIAGQASR